MLHVDALLQGQEENKKKELGTFLVDSGTAFIGFLSVVRGVFVYCCLELLVLWDRIGPILSHLLTLLLAPLARFGQAFKDLIEQ